MFIYNERVNQADSAGFVRCWWRFRAMRWNLISFAAAIFLLFPAMAKSKQATASRASSQFGNQTTPNLVQDCSGDFEALRAARQVVDGNPRPTHAQSVLEVSSETKDDAPDAASGTVDLEQDLKLLEQKQTDLSACILGNYAQELAQDSPAPCFGELAMNFEMRHDGEPEQDIPIGRLPGSRAFFYEAGMTIDADGAPNAYHPDNSGLDDLANAGTPGRWEGLAKDANGKPYIQGQDDPFPGYYVSETALADRSKAVNDPARYVDASRIPFIVLPGIMARELGARVGDFAIVFNRR